MAINWGEIRAAAIALNSTNDAAKRAASTLPEQDRARFIARVNKRAYRERWIDKAKVLAATAQKGVSQNVLTGSQVLQTLDTDAAILSLAEKRRYLATIVRTPVGDVTERSPLAQKVKRRVDKDGGSSEEIELPGKLRAIELDARLAGELDGSASIGVSIQVLNGNVAMQ